MSPSKTKDRLSTNVPGVPLDESNLVSHNILYSVVYLFLFVIIILEFYAFATSILQIIKALNLYRKKTGTDNYFWVKQLSWILLIFFPFFKRVHRMISIHMRWKFYLGIDSEYVIHFKTVGRFILIKRCRLGQGLVVAAVMLQQHCGQQINLVVALPLRRNSNNGQVRLVRIFHFSSLMEQLFVLAEVRYVFILHGM